MRPAIRDLAQLPDHRLFKEIATGIRQIVENAESLESTAVRLARMKEHRACGIIRSLVEEESAKVLILLDVARCPKQQGNGRSRALSSFYSHLAKRIYAGACSWRPSDFRDLERYIDLEQRDYYLDGPNDVDWIFPNDAKAGRESRMYVDYVRDLTEDDGERYWVSPIARGERHEERATPTCLGMVRALHRVGMTTQEGLNVVSHVWKEFQPSPETTSIELSQWTRRTLEEVLKNETYSDLIEEDLQAIVFDWSFPLWPFCLTKMRKQSLEELRSQREEEVRRREEIEAQRDPPPTVSRDKVVELSKAYFEWEQERDRPMAEHRSGKFVTLSTSLVGRLDALDSYKRLKGMIRGLMLEERMDLAALAWFGKLRQSGWAFCHQNARKTIGNDLNYECGIGAHWLTGFERWEKVPELPATLVSGRKKA